MSIAVIGAGMAGIACARALTRAGHEVVVLERAHSPGGRMASPVIGGRPVDTGAAYFTVAGPEFTEVAADWRERGLATEWTDTLGVWSSLGRTEKSGPPRWRAPRGLRSLVVDFADGLDVRLEHPVGRVGPGPTVDGADYDAVVLAMPDPQAARLLDESLTAVREQVGGAVWEPIVAVSMGAAGRTWGELSAMFINDHPVLSLVADDGARRGDDAPVLVAHTTTELAAQHLEHPDAVVDRVVTAVREVLDTHVDVLWTRAHRWSLARPAEPREQRYWLSDTLGLCGDGWGTSKVETAWTSGDALGLALAGVS